ncbi:ferredoxin [Williamsia sp. DF01-3]|uniref:ferredoxin n=1 Tax=Williamsia sp. DF01-3 TaxID=2934157 RepID=UPI0035AFC0A6
MAADIYDIDDDGYCTVDRAPVPPGLEPLARDGAAACPEQAIILETSRGRS